MNKQMGNLLVQILGIKVLLILVVLAVCMSSCSRYGSGCDGNKKMLTAGAGYTKFRR